ncbi:hypothetical protein GMRT_13982 [Giardia muris]|uniref:Uncharacterized protein n=1 Tax=Giardia muris TaxID=5742 RepID=A0A4Z1SUV3_GIAMU|nr:hypothetical protein GMRT_13982 [Giardia muris]|eukprot:TNJ29594.1 hypothetical protein GMRT_13982 [Giardia muris]
MQKPLEGAVYKYGTAGHEPQAPNPKPNVDTLYVPVAQMIKSANPPTKLPMTGQPNPYSLSQNCSSKGRVYLNQERRVNTYSLTAYSKVPK